VKIASAFSAALALSIAIAGVGPAQARDSVAEGRSHLRKANALAGNDRCEAAIKEYSLAFEKLHDPVVLFNRAECYRRIGEDASAAADYRAFLEAVPTAPNRAEIEGKIAALDLGPASGEAPSATRAPPTVRAAHSAPTPNAVTPNLGAPGFVPEAAVITAPAGPESPVVPSSTEAEAPGHHGRLWMWAALGAAVVGGAVGAYLVLRTPGATPPSTELGNYRF
jgi:tetratricopeptide (TPR) repeat protein